jgi:hypothetical protein
MLYIWASHDVPWLPIGFHEGPWANRKTSMRIVGGYVVGAAESHDLGSDLP